MAVRILAAAALLVGASEAAAQEKVGLPPVAGMTARIMFERGIRSAFPELSRFKIRATEVTVEPGVAIPEHTHQGPGLRILLEGRVTFTQEGATTTFAGGGYWFEEGYIPNSGRNSGERPARLIIVEILPIE